MERIAVIPSGGKGLRAGFKTPKQYVRVAGKEVIVRTLEVFQNCPLIDRIIIAAEEEYFTLLENIKTNYSLSKITSVCRGGKERQDSVYNALIESKADENDIIAVHDAARPLLPASVLTDALISAEKFDNVVVAIKAKDTLIKAAGQSVESYIDRNSVYYAQTPQVARYGNLLRAMEKAGSTNFSGTDESMLLKNASYNVKIVEGSALNFKITSQSDFHMFEMLLR